MSTEKRWDYVLGALIAGLGIALAHYTFHRHD